MFHYVNILITKIYMAEWEEWEKSRLKQQLTRKNITLFRGKLLCQEGRRQYLNLKLNKTFCTNRLKLLCISCCLDDRRHITFHIKVCFLSSMWMKITKKNALSLWRKRSFKAKYLHKVKAPYLKHWKYSLILIY